MTDQVAYGAGGALASLALHQIQFTVMLKHGLITPQQLREILDGLILKYEQEQDTAFVNARAQVQMLSDVLEQTCPEMVVTRWMTAPGGPEA